MRDVLRKTGARPKSVRAVNPVANGHAAPAIAVELEIPSARTFRAVGRLVVGGFASRHGATVDRIFDLQLALDFLLSQATHEGSIEVVMRATADELRVEVGPLADDAQARHEVRRIVSDLVEDVSAHDVGDAGVALVVANASHAIPS